jgi:hypothetical protein
MATINTITFDQASYNAGATITCTIDYTPDVASVVPTTFTATVNVVNASGTTVATQNADFVVNEPQAGSDSVQVSDSGNRTWTEGATTPDPTVSGNLDVVFTAEA